MSSGLRVRVRRHRTALILTAFVLAVVAISVVAGQRPGNTVPLDPENAGPDGARALARVLERHDVDVTVARGAAALESQSVTEGTTVVVTSTEQLGESTLSRLRDHASAGDVVLVDPPGWLTTSLTTPPTRVRIPQHVSGACADPEFSDLAIRTEEALAFDGPGCFGHTEGSLLVSPAAGLTLWGAGQALSNEQVVRADNAAVALRLVGGGSALVWYVPDARDLTAGDALPLSETLPDWILPGLWVLALSGLALVGWRIRRLGALAVEPIPVVVKAVETTLARGRLYQRAGDRGHAAVALRTASLHRLARRLRTGSHDPEDVVAAVVALTGRESGDVGRLLSPHSAAPPRTDRELIHLAGQLATLEEEVRHA
ncbi:DUF4350 domain-containing protein [Nocardioides gilvus]|uniref:DUF4350 domain-containing protein n=1 Tax=Nocardioides gilvus TaxID=1735589 RepID=UPI000D7453D4|nr:DUF4350 domain-containing protein [Nocardioides gilvus]